MINWGHKALKIVPSNQWTMEKRGTKCVEIAGEDDKRQITAVFACAMSGNTVDLQRMLLTLPMTGLMKVSYLDNVIVP